MSAPRIPSDHTRDSAETNVRGGSIRGSSEFRLAGRRAGSFVSCNRHHRRSFHVCRYKEEVCTSVIGDLPSIKVVGTLTVLMRCADRVSARTNRSSPFERFSAVDGRLARERKPDRCRRVFVGCVYLRTTLALYKLPAQRPGSVVVGAGV